jgi:hypothetical protein
LKEGGLGRQAWEGGLRREGGPPHHSMIYYILLYMVRCKSELSLHATIFMTSQVYSRTVSVFDNSDDILFTSYIQLCYKRRDYTQTMLTEKAITKANSKVIEDEQHRCTRKLAIFFG